MADNWIRPDRLDKLAAEAPETMTVTELSLRHGKRTAVVPKPPADQQFLDTPFGQLRRAPPDPLAELADMLERERQPPHEFRGEPVAWADYPARMREHIENSPFLLELERRRRMPTTDREKAAEAFREILNVISCYTGGVLDVTPREFQAAAAKVNALASAGLAAMTAGKTSQKGGET